MLTKLDLQNKAAIIMPGSKIPDGMAEISEVKNSCCKLRNFL